MARSSSEVATRSLYSPSEPTEPKRIQRVEDYMNDLAALAQATEMSSSDRKRLREPLAKAGFSVMQITRWSTMVLLPGGINRDLLRTEIKESLNETSGAN